MQKKITWIWIAFLPLLSLAQSKQPNFFSVTVSGGITGAGISTTKKLQPANASYNVRFNFGAHAWYTYALGNDWDLQLGLGYVDAGFRRQQKNIQYLDPTYPGIGSGMIIDKTNTRKDINYDYRFHYLQVPVLFNYKVAKSKDFKSNYMLTGGINVDVLLKHRLTARLENFTVDGEKKYQFDSTGMKANVITASLSIGARLEHKLDKSTTLIIHPVFNYYPLSVTNSDIKINPYTLMIHAGVVINIASKNQ